MAAEEPKKTPALSAAVSGAKTAATAIKAAGKAAVGDIAGAIVDIAKDGKLVKMVVSIVLVISLLVSLIFIATGSAVVMVVENVISVWNQNYDEMVMDNAIESRGNKLWLMFANQGSVFQATWNTISDMFSGPDNHESGTDFDSNDYKTTVDAVIDQESFAGQDGALLKRIDLIRGRVEERGKQIQKTIAAYEWDAFGLKVALNICESVNNFFLYNGISGTTLNIDTSCFSLTDIQCLKILAAYCVQNECDLHNADIVDLMDYLGWYALQNGSASMEDSVDAGTIYATPLIGRFVNEFYGAYSAGTVVGTGDSSKIELDPPSIPVWKGTFLPQYMIEEISQLKKMEAEGKIALPRNSAGDIDWAKCSTHYTSVAGHGIIDYLYTGSAFASFSRTAYTGIDADIDEFLAELVDTGLGAIADWWNGLWGDKDPKFVSATKQGVNGKCTVKKYMYADGSPSTYSTVTSDDLIVYEPQTVYISQTGTDVYTKMICRKVIGGDSLTDPVGGSQFAAVGLLPDAEYSIYIASTDENGETTYEWVDTFTTVFDTEDGSVYQAYQIAVNVDVTYRARSIDELALDLAGLWPGDLDDVVSTASGSLRPVGHADNSLLKLNWNDSITDANGKSQNLTFTRMRGYQYEYYLDYVAGIANTLGLDTTGVFVPEYNYGDDLVTIANEEFQYYTQNDLTDGYRYWDICTKATGIDCSSYARSNADWSTIFVLACAYQCGYLGDDQCFGGFGCNAATWPMNCTELYNAMRSESVTACYEDTSYVPTPGDLVFFATMGKGSRLPERMAIVVDVSPSGQLFTIEGDCNDAVQKCTYEDYRAGAYAYDMEDVPVYISSYISPKYNTQDQLGTQYMFNHALATTSAAGITQVHIRNVPSTTILVGAGRFRLSQLRNVLDCIVERQPSAATDAYRTLSDAIDLALMNKENNTLTADNIGSLCDRWFDFKDSYTGDLGQTLREITARNYVGPLMESIKATNKFDWGTTKVRREILWLIATSTDLSHAAKQTLNALVSSEDNTLSDEALLKKLMRPVQETAPDGTDTVLFNSYLAYILTDYQGMLWPEDHTYLRQAWIDCAEKNLNVLREQFLTGV